MSYGKLRVNYAEVGQGATALALYDYYIQSPALGNTAIATLPLTKNNQDLVPERTKSGEIGIEGAFLESRVGGEVTLYQQNTINQIIPLRVSTASGYSARYVNSGEVRNRGVEVSAFVVPVKTENFNWRLSANWTRNRNEVLSLFNGVDNIVLATYQGGISSNATVGEAFGSLRGSNFVYKNGQRVVTEDGVYAFSSSNSVIGDPNPKWRGGVTNTLTYKNIALTFLVDVRQGGQVFSLDRYYGLGGGLQPETAKLNDLGNPSRLPIADGGGIILPGVLEDGTPNNIRVENDANGVYGYGGTPNAGFVYDASYVKLREASLNYTLPKAISSRLGFVKGIDLSIVGRNLWIIHKNLPDADPEEGLSSGNLGQGYQSGSYPTTRTLGANIRLSF